MSDEALLSNVRRGTAEFGRLLEALPDAGLNAPSLLPGWSRRHVVAHVAYNARALGRLVDWARTGVETPMYASKVARNAEIDAGVRLGTDALRELFHASAADLDENWGRLTDDQWRHPVRTNQGAVVPVSATVWMRTREVWVHGADLGAGASFADFPHEVLERLLGDIVTAWTSRGDQAGLRLVVTDSPQAALGDVEAADPEIVSGALADLTAWACGRGSAGIASTHQAEPVAPRWL